jgi:hypothetical protein
MVSSHFNYFEEYVLSHSPEWLFRKARQAQKERWEASRERVSEQVQGLYILLGSLFNNNQSLEDMLPPSFEEMLKTTEKKNQHPVYETEFWWKSEPDN